ncbi:PepSY domain-containing protein [Sandaracinobacter sp. RS1-74]|uniref:PepSY-associated TM helix domain-containing protein n=1 Tax=Sandaracinobacteroides sayramensis TaxID=2913411 RepID=UPI001ED9C8D3|nr:PepSY-associated TM helix domain-containing protein [Sandaracinobacteroides sayramensis]MCG2840660.1 PepSY domain-containing protein [Sandaracinobacteroides sayramensis]
MAQLHTWAGLLPGWLLFAIFVFGTTAFFQQEISCWMRPELGNGAVSREALDRAAVHLSAKAQDAAHWTISLPLGRGGEPLSISWERREGVMGASGEAKLDPVSGQEVAVRDTSGGWFLYRFHYDLHYMPVMWARTLVCVAALAMLVAVLSGIVTHKKIFADFFLLRFGKGQRSWLDAHNVTAVLALPFHLMITYTGLVTLLFTLMPWAITANFPTTDAYYEAAFPPGPKAEARGKTASLLPLPELVGRAKAALTGDDPGYIAISNPGDANAIVEAWPHYDRLAGTRSAVFLNGVTGEVLQAPSTAGGARVTQTVMIDLHAGRFSGPVLRWLYFLSGIGGTVMVASGLVLWTVKRRAKLPDPTRPHFGFRLVERLNIGVIAGSCAGIAVYFLANRLLPLDVANRADWEINSLFIVWGAVFVWTIARPTKRAWLEALSACAALYALVPAVNALTTPRGLIPSLIAGDWVFVGFDLVMLAMAAACAFTAWKVATHKPKALPRKKRMTAEAAL